MRKWNYVDCLKKRKEQGWLLTTWMLLQSHLKRKKAERRVEKIKRRSNEDINALGPQHIKSFSAEGLLNEIHIIL